MEKSDLHIWIDPGHAMSNVTPGKFDPGASANGSREADIALEYALSLKFHLVKRGVKVSMSRYNATDPAPVSTRDNRAKAAGCTHSISIHLNAGSSAHKGVETFYRDAADKVLAQLVNDVTVSVTGLYNRKLKTESQSQHPRLAVLEFAPPACLLELGFITNLNDLKVLKQDSTRIRWAETLAEKLIEKYGG